MTPLTYLVYGFEGRGGRYLVQETVSAVEARELRDVREASGFRTTVFGPEGEMTVQELDRFADLETRFR